MTDGPIGGDVSNSVFSRLGSGRGLGTATGRITLNVNDVAKARTTIVRESKLIIDLLKIVGSESDKAAKKASTSYRDIAEASEKSAKRVTTSWSQVGNALKGLGLIGGGISLIGVKTAGEVENGQ